MNLFWIACAALAGGGIVYLLHLEQTLHAERAAKEKLEGQLALAHSDTKQEITQTVAGVKSALERYGQFFEQFENKQHHLYGKIENALSSVLSAEQTLRIEASSLKRALTDSPGIRGHWGQTTLQQILEQNSFVRGVHFETQSTLVSEDQTEGRPDFIFYLPGGRRLAIDAKEVTGEYLLAQETDDPEKQKQHYEKLVQNIRQNSIQLSRKEYQSLLDPQIPFVIMFIPSEPAIRVAFTMDPLLFQEAHRRKVFLASPMTIIPMVLLIAQAWQEHELAQNARELGAVVEELGNKLGAFAAHLVNMRDGLEKSAQSWNKALSSWNTRVSPQLEKVKSMGGKLKDLPELESLPSDLRAIELKK